MLAAKSLINGQTKCEKRRPIAATEWRRPKPQRVLAAHAVATAAELKAELRARAGSQCGRDKSADEKRELEDFVKRFASVAPAKPAQTPMAGTTWKLLFTNSEGQSAGKVGPFVGDTLQVFPKERPGEYINTLQFGNFLRFELEGVYEAGSADRVDLEFKNLRVFLGGLQVVKRPFPPAFKGFWQCLYVDEDLRIFYTNKDNLFVLCRQ